MSDVDRLQQVHFECIDDLDEFIDDHKFQDFDHSDEGDECLKEFNIVVGSFKKSQSELKSALGDKYEDTYGGRENFTDKYRGYRRNLISRIRELKKCERKHQEETRDAELKRQENTRAAELKLAAETRATELRLAAETRAAEIELEKLKLISEKEIRASELEQKLKQA